MTARRAITHDRAVRIGKSVACPNCQEYSFKKVSATLASESHRTSLNAHWVVRRHCGICGVELEIGLDAKGDLVFGE